MQYNTFTFLGLFLGLTLLAYYVTPLKARWGVLLGASAVFYLVGGRQLILVVALTTFVIYIAARGMEKISAVAKERRKLLPKEERKAYKAKMAGKKRRVLAAACIFAVGLLLFLKYFNFFGSSFNALWEKLHLSWEIPYLHLLLPLGISFYTLSAVSYLADVYWEKYPAEKNYFKLLLFLIFFPVIVEGPISRYDQLGSQLYEGHKFDYYKFTSGLQLIVWGLFKKMVIADRIDGFVSVIFGSYGDYGGLAVALAILLYTIQLYTEFSGCMDIVTGCARLFGISLAKNFEQPFFSRNVNEFWRRWHITLGAFLRDYVFYPISLSKFFQKLSKGARKHFNEYYAMKIPAAAALFAVWFCNGIWHGAEWKYICYGLYYYVIMLSGMLLEPLFKKICGVIHLNREENRGFHVFQVVRTCILVGIGMLIFRAENLRAAGRMFLSLFNREAWHSAGFFWDVGMDPYEYLVILLGVLIVLYVGIKNERKIIVRDRIASRKTGIRMAIYTAGVAAVILLGAYGPGYGAVDFIYAQF